MSEGETEEQEAAIIRKVYSGGYAHAENIMRRLTHLKLRLAHPEAVEQLHSEVVDEMSRITSP